MLERCLLLHDERLHEMTLPGVLPHVRGVAQVGMWLVGNELNLPSAGFVCDADAAGGAANASSCQMTGAQLEEFFAYIDELCEVVRGYDGLLCSTALAEFPLPASYDFPAHLSGEGATRWVLALDPIMVRASGCAHAQHDTVVHARVRNCTYNCSWHALLSPSRVS